MFELIPSGSVSSVPGFLAGAVRAGIKTRDDLDLAILYSEVPCTATGVFTANRIKSAPVILSQGHLLRGKAQAIVANSGCANACVGEQGTGQMLWETAKLAATKLSISPGESPRSQHGRDWEYHWPMDCIRAGIEKIRLHKNGRA